MALELPQFDHGIRDPLLLVPTLRIVLFDLGVENEDVLVHQGCPELGARDLAPGGGDHHHRDARNSSDINLSDNRMQLMGCQVKPTSTESIRAVTP
jgi:hypothetical protein